MKLGLVIVTYNRPEYLKECLESLERANISPDVEIVIVDDCSTDNETKRLIGAFSKEHNCAVIFNQRNEKISSCLLTGFEHLLQAGCTVLMNLDSDAIVRNDFIERILEVLACKPENIVTGFNCLTKNADGSERHRVISTSELMESKCSQSITPKYNFKASVGGLNMCFSQATYLWDVKPALVETLNGGNWDHKACISDGGAYCTVPSVVQHIGIKSSLGHEHDKPDVADDFIPLVLPDVTLFGVDTFDGTRLIKASIISQENIQFGDVLMLTDPQLNIKSKEDYSRFIINEAHKSINTTHVLIIQYDGYVLNWKAWNPEWLQYDYIGAPWMWYKDGKQVGNGGFSLRSKRLMEIVSKMDIPNCHPEDDVICRQYREVLEKEHNIKFAPLEVAERFSIEGYNQPGAKYTGQFGFHGQHLNKADLVTGKTAIIEQYFGIGDVIFSIGIADHLISQGYKVLWPVKPEFLDGLQSAYPHITFEDWRKVKIDYNNKRDIEVDGKRLIPLRWTYEILRVPFKDCMRSKYDFMGLKWEEWRNSPFKRNEAKETALFDYLGLSDGQPYILINETFRTDSTGKHRILPSGPEKRVTMSQIPGFSLFDWSRVIEKASKIYTVSTSIIYIMELLELEATEIHIYLRWPDEKDHRNYEYLMTRHKYIFEV